MKLFEKIQHLVNKPPKVEPEIFLSLILDETFIQAGAWILDEGKKSRIVSTASERAATPTWEDRIRMADHAIGKLEEETGSTKISKVVFGLGERFLTDDGNIEKSVRPHLKKLTGSLELVPLGFVPLSTSIAHFLRKTEGIPASVILIGVTEKDFDISIYRVGRLAFSIAVKRTESEGEDIEKGLKACTDADVLPSRILLYGADDVRIQEVKLVLLRHQWTARANFLHYPKIELYPFDHLIDTVVEAGAGEITHELIEDGSPAELIPEKAPGDSGPEEEPETDEGKKDEERKGVLAEEPHQVEREDKGIPHMVVVQPETLGFHEEGEGRKFDTRSGEKGEETVRVEEVENPLEFAEEEAKKNLLEQEPEIPDEKDFFDQSPKAGKGRISTIHFPQKLATVTRIGKSIFRKTPKKIVGAGILIFILIGGCFWAATQYLPRATVQLAVLPKTITREDTVVIDPQATAIDTEKKVIPGKKLEKVVSGEKVMPASGKKKIGDPSKGAVTIYNKSEGASHTLKKGTILTTGGIQFVLDADVSIASASMTLSGDQLTFGKATANVTASVVGPEGNIDANKEFSFKEYGTNILTARNEKSFSGGTSKEVTVISRADTDNLLKALTADLIEKAKTELSQSVSGGERMIDQTIKTAVKEKQFVEEIDQEAKDLHGTLSVSVSAYTYNEGDIETLLSGIAQKDIPSGYSVNPGRTTVSIADVTIAKDGKMTAKATLTASALPTIDQTGIKKAIAGKKLSDVEQELKIIPGVASAEFSFTSSWKKDVLPTNPEHISITVTTVE